MADRYVRAALVAGVNDYGEASDLAPLRFAEADAALMAGIFEKDFQFDRVVSLAGCQASREGLYAALEEFGRERWDLFVFYFGGHGEYFDAAGMHCLHPYGSKAGDDILALSLAGWAERILKKVPAGHTLLIVDACRNRLHRQAAARGDEPGLCGSILDPLRELGVSSREVGQRRPPEGPGDAPRFLTTLLACGIGQKSWEDETLGHGVFTHYLHREIQARGRREPLDQLVRKAGSSTRSWCEQRRKPLQVPELIFPALEEATLYLAGQGEPVAAGGDPLFPVLHPLLGRALAEITPSPPSPSGSRGRCRRYENGFLFRVDPSGEGENAAGGADPQPVIDSPLGLYYQSLGGSGSALGFPAGAEGPARESTKGGLKSDGQVQFFENGVIYRTDRYGAQAQLHGPIRDRFAAAEARQGNTLTGGAFGFPIEAEAAVFSSRGTTGQVQRCEFGLIVASGAGTFGVLTGFYDLYRSLGEWRGPLGFPLGEEEDIVSAASGQAGHVQWFENGAMVWRAPDCKEVPVFGPIFRLWQAGERRAGFPLTPPYALPSGQAQMFEAGGLSSDESPDWERGSALDALAGQGATHPAAFREAAEKRRSGHRKPIRALGPVERFGETGEIQHFREEAGDGFCLARPGGLARVLAVQGPFHQKYADCGGPRGWLGWPREEEHPAAAPLTGSEGRCQKFEKGALAVVNSTRLARSRRHQGVPYKVYGAIGHYWSVAGEAGSWLGFPLSDEQAAEGGRRHEFEGGWLYWPEAVQRVMEARRVFSWQEDPPLFEQGWRQYAGAPDAGCLKSTVDAEGLVLLRFLGGADKAVRYPASGSLDLPRRFCALTFSCRDEFRFFVQVAAASGDVFHLCFSSSVAPPRFSWPGEFAYPVPKEWIDGRRRSLVIDLAGLSRAVPAEYARIERFCFRKNLDIYDLLVSDEAVCLDRLAEQPEMVATLSLAELLKCQAAQIRKHIRSGQIRFPKSGTKGLYTYIAQCFLRRLGLDPGPLDGTGGRRTDAAIRRFQAQSGLAEDGVVGQQTWAALLECLEKLAASPVLESQARFDPDSQYQIMAKHSGRILAVEDGEMKDGAKVTLAAPPVKAGGLWYLVPHDEGCFRIVSAGSGLCLDAKGAGTADGTRVHLWSGHGGDNQRWYIVPLGDGTCRIVAKHSGKSLDGSSQDGGARVHLWHSHGGDNQKWRIEDASK